MKMKSITVRVTKPFYTKRNTFCTEKKPKKKRTSKKITHGTAERYARILGEEYRRRSGRNRTEPAKPKVSMLYKPIYNIDNQKKNVDSEEEEEELDDSKFDESDQGSILLHMESNASILQKRKQVIVIMAQNSVVVRDEK